jgi:hypothetical protein
MNALRADPPDARRVKPGLLGDLSDQDALQHGEYIRVSNRLGPECGLRTRLSILARLWHSRAYAISCKPVRPLSRMVKPFMTRSHQHDTLRRKLGVARRRQIPGAYRTQTGRDPLARDLEPAR